ILIGEGAVDFGGIEEGDAALHGGADQGDHLAALMRRAVAEAHAHAAEAEGGDLKVAVAESALLHGGAFQFVPRYWASVTCSSQSTALPSSCSWMAMWVM